MFINNIQDFKNIAICNINCGCKNGYLEMDLKQINEMLKIKSKNEQNNENSGNEREICTLHNLKQNYFCKNCQMYICQICCSNKEHKSHEIIENSKYALLYKDFIKHMPLRFKSIEEFIINFEKVANNTELEVVSFSVGGDYMYYCAARGITVMNGKVNIKTKEPQLLSADRKLSQIISIK